MYGGKYPTTRKKLGFTVLTNGPYDFTKDKAKKNIAHENQKNHRDSISSYPEDSEGDIIMRDESNIDNTRSRSDSLDSLFVEKGDLGTITDLIGMPEGNSECPTADDTSLENSCAIASFACCIEATISNLIFGDGGLKHIIGNLVDGPNGSSLPEYEAEPLSVNGIQDLAARNDYITTITPVHTMTDVLNTIPKTSKVMLAFERGPIDEFQCLHFRRMRTRWQEFKNRFANSERLLNKYLCK